MSEPEMDNAPAPDNAQQHIHDNLVSAGARLAAARKERGWSVEQVASQLNLAQRQIVALEQDDYPSLPGMPIVRGFIRSYAKLLKIDAAPLLALVGGETVMAHESLQPQKSLAAPFSETRLPSMADRASMSSKWVIGGLVVVLAAVGLWAANLAPDVGSLQKTASDQVKDGIAYLSGSEAGKPAVESQSAQQTVQPPQDASQVSTVPAPVVADAPKEDAPKPSSEESKTADQAASPVDASKPPAFASAKASESQSKTQQAGKDALVFNAREDSWIEVRRAGDKGVLLSRVVKAGTSETVEVAEPVAVVVGNAAGVDATLRGEPLELKSGGGNVARLSLK